MVLHGGDAREIYRVYQSTVGDHDVMEIHSHKNVGFLASCQRIDHIVEFVAFVNGAAFL